VRGAPAGLQLRAAAEAHWLLGFPDDPPTHAGPATLPPVRPAHPASRSRPTPVPLLPAAPGSLAARLCCRGAAGAGPGSRQRLGVFLGRRPPPPPPENSYTHTNAHIYTCTFCQVHSRVPADPPLPLRRRVHRPGDGHDCGGAQPPVQERAAARDPRLCAGVHPELRQGGWEGSSRVAEAQADCLRALHCTVAGFGRRRCGRPPFRSLASHHQHHPACGTAARR
jgi:hypothetical protein